MFHYSTGNEKPCFIGKERLFIFFLLLISLSLLNFDRAYLFVRLRFCVFSKTRAFSFQIPASFVAPCCTFFTRDESRACFQVFWFRTEKLFSTLERCFNGMLQSKMREREGESWNRTNGELPERITKRKTYSERERERGKECPWNRSYVYTSPRSLR